MNGKGRSRSTLRNKIMEPRKPSKTEADGVFERVLEVFHFNYQDLPEVVPFEKAAAKTHTEESSLWDLNFLPVPPASSLKSQHPPPRKPSRKKFESRYDCTRLVGRRHVKLKPLVPYSSKGNSLIMEAQEYLGIHEALVQLSKSREQDPNPELPPPPPEKHVKFAESTADYGRRSRNSMAAELRRKESPLKLPSSFNWFIMNPKPKFRKKIVRRKCSSVRKYPHLGKPLCLRPPFRMKTYPFRNRMDGFCELTTFLQETHEGVELLYEESCCLASLGPKGLREENKRHQREEVNETRAKFLRDQRAMETDELAWNLLARKYSFSFVPSITSVGKEVEVEIIHEASHPPSGESESETEMEPEFFEEPAEAEEYDGCEADAEDSCTVDEPSNGNLHYWQ